MKRTSSSISSNANTNIPSKANCVSARKLLIPLPKSSTNPMNRARDRYHKGLKNNLSGILISVTLSFTIAVVITFILYLYAPIFLDTARSVFDNLTLHTSDTSTIDKIVPKLGIDVVGNSYMHPKPVTYREFRKEYFGTRPLLFEGRSSRNGEVIGEKEGTESTLLSFLDDQCGDMPMQGRRLSGLDLTYHIVMSSSSASISRDASGNGNNDNGSASASESDGGFSSRGVEVMSWKDVFSKSGLGQQNKKLLSYSTNSKLPYLVFNAAYPSYNNTNSKCAWKPNTQHNNNNNNDNNDNKVNNLHNSWSKYKYPILKVNEDPNDPVYATIFPLYNEPNTKSVSSWSPLKLTISSNASNYVSGSSFHAHSHSFSELLVGIKKWIFVRDLAKNEGFVAEWNAEKNMIDFYSDVDQKSRSSGKHTAGRQAGGNFTGAIKDVSFRRNELYYYRAAIGVTEVVQHAGEVIYVPEGMLHGTICLTESCVSIGQEYSNSPFLEHDSSENFIGNLNVKGGDTEVAVGSGEDERVVGNEEDNVTIDACASKGYICKDSVEVDVGGVGEVSAEDSATPSKDVEESRKCCKSARNLKFHTSQSRLNANISSSLSSSSSSPLPSSSSSNNNQHRRIIVLTEPVQLGEFEHSQAAKSSKSNSRMAQDDNNNNYDNDDDNESIFVLFKDAARMANKQKNYLGAIKKIKTAIAMCKIKAPVEYSRGNIMFQLYYELGNIYMLLKQEADAKKAYNNCINENKKFAACYSRLLNILYNEEDSSSASSSSNTATTSSLLTSSSTTTSNTGSMPDNGHISSQLLERASLMGIRGLVLELLHQLD